MVPFLSALKRGCLLAMPEARTQGLASVINELIAH
jgi:hypothetical protein